jgi:hypothetical protein
MRRSDIAGFVSEVIAAGAPICAVGRDVYVICETEVPDGDVRRVAEEVQAICDKYGPRDHLRLEIVWHLRSLGRYVDHGDLPMLDPSNWPSKSRGGRFTRIAGGGVRAASGDGSFLGEKPGARPRPPRHQTIDI